MSSRRELRRRSLAELIKTTPQQIIATGIDLAFMRQLRKELKP